MIGFSVQLKSPAITCCPNNVRRVKNTGRKREKSDKKKKKLGHPSDLVNLLPVQIFVVDNRQPSMIKYLFFAFC